MRKGQEEWIKNHSTLPSSAVAISPEPTEEHCGPIHIEVAGSNLSHAQTRRGLCGHVRWKGVSLPEAILADDAVDLVINLTIHNAHVEVIAQCLNAGKHVYSEKPIALTSEEAWKLVALAEEKGRCFGCAPITMLGEAQQTAWKAIRDGLLGTVRVAYVEVNWGRIEAWHPAPVPFYIEQKKKPE